MKAITVRGIDDELDEALRKQADTSATSINATVLRVLRDALGLGKRKFRRRHHDLDHLAGTWSEDERRSFDEATSAFSHIDEQMWR